MMEMRNQVVVVGAGARTPLGLSLPASAAAVRAGISVIDDHPFMIDRFGEPMKVMRDADAEIGLGGVERAVELAASAAAEALRPIRQLGEPVALLVSTGETRPGQSAGFAAAVHEQLRTRLGSEFVFEGGGSMEGGHAGGLLAVHHACDVLAKGRARFCLAGGVDSYLVPETLEWLDEAEQLHSEGNIYGFCPAEGAGFCLLATLETARRAGLRPLLEVAGTAAAHEEKRIKTKTICLGEGLSAAFGDVFAPMPPEPLVDRILCDMNGERYRGNEYGFAALRHAERFRDAADFETPADCWGDCGAASGPLHVGLVSEAEARGYAKGPLSLLWASSEGGIRSALLLAGPRGSA